MITNLLRIYELKRAMLSAHITQMREYIRNDS